jgi:cytochrome P450
MDENALTDLLLDSAIYAGDPSPLYAWLWAEAPVARNDAVGLWMVSRHEEVVAVSRDPGTFCSAKGIMTFEIGSAYPTPPTMMHTDPPDHTRYRTLVQPGFRPSYMRALEPRIRARALVDRIEPGVPVDVVSDLDVLARVEGRILLEELLARFGSITPAGDVVRTASSIIAGVKSAPVVFGSR